MPAMAAIRRHHPASHLTLLTSAGLAELGERSGWFDRIEVDDRPGWLDVPGWLRVRRRLRAGLYDRVYDLQAQDRTALYFRLFWPGKRPEWSGIVRGASHPHLDPNRGRMHALDIHAAQLRIAGIGVIPKPDLGWIDDPRLAELDLPSRFALLIPGAAPHRPAKRWPTDLYAGLARRLAEKGIVPMIVGSEDERDLAQRIRTGCPEARDLTGRTTLLTIGGLARRAVVAIGNDTGPMHLTAMIGCRSVVLFSAESNPDRAAPRGANVVVLRRDNLADLPLEEVIGAVG